MASVNSAPPIQPMTLNTSSAPLSSAVTDPFRPFVVILPALPIWPSPWPAGLRSSCCTA